MEMGAVLGAFHHAAQDMVASPVLSQTFEGDDIEGFFYDAQAVFIAFGIGADTTEGVFGHMEASGAGMERMEAFQCLSEGLKLILVLLEEVEHEALCHPRSDRGE